MPFRHQLVLLLISESLAVRQGQLVATRSHFSSVAVLLLGYYTCGKSVELPYHSTDYH
jgi:hypothetical protein